MAEQQTPTQASDSRGKDLPPGVGEAALPANSDDDEPMVHRTPRDYATWARQERVRRIADGADPEMIILQSEVRNHVPRQEGESGADFARHYSETMNAMIRRGVAILNDMCVADVVPDTFSGGGRVFDLGPASGVTKGEYREFKKWFSKACETGIWDEVPEKWSKFEKPAEEQSEQYLA